MSTPRPQPSATARPELAESTAIPVIGLIGGIGSGKSRVAALLSARGAVVIDADAVGHEVLERPEVRRGVVERFGAGVLSALPGSGSPAPPVDRRALGALVFGDASALRDLEALVHPPMERRFQEQIEQAAREGRATLVVLDAAILLEKGWDRFCDLVLFVDAPWETRLARVSSTRGWSAETLRAREAAQWPVERKRSRAQAVIRNDDGIADLEARVDAFLDGLGRPDPRPPRRDETTTDERTSMPAAGPRARR
jgi:dephospho-CoA kinase